MNYLARTDLIRQTFLHGVTMPLVDVSADKISTPRSIDEIEIIPDHAITYDLRGLPDDYTLEHIKYYVKNYGIVLYDSSKKGQRPSFIGPVTEFTTEIDPFKK